MYGSYFDDLLPVLSAVGGFLIAIIVIWSLAFPFMTAWLASQKGRSAVSWFFLTLFFGLFAFFPLAFSPNKEPKI